MNGKENEWLIAKYNIVSTKMPTNHRFKNRSGETTSNGIMVLEYLGKDKNRDTFYMCKCICGKSFVARNTNLNNVRSCGCRINKKATTSHAHSTATAEYNILVKLIYSRKDLICDEWKDPECGYDNFYNWLHINGYKRGMHILRKDSSKKYSPDNCIIASSSLTRKFNKNATYITIGNYTYPLTVWALITGMRINSIMNRYITYGWSKTDAIITPIRGIPGKDKITLVIPPEIERLNGCGQ